MKRSVLIALFYVGASSSAALAGAVSVTGTLNETLDGSNNYFLSDSPAGHTYRSFSQLNLNALLATPDTRYVLNSNVSYYKYFGHGARDINLTWGTPLSEQLSILHDTYWGKFNFAASWARSDVETTSLQQTGFAAGRGSVDNYDLDAGFQRQLSQIDSLSWTAHASTVSYSDSNGSPYVDFSSNASWRRRLTPLTNISYSMNFDWYFSNDTSDTERKMWNPAVSIDTQLTKRLSFVGSGGLTYIDVTQGQSQPAFISSIFQNVPSGIPFSGPSTQQVGTALGWNVNAVLAYQLLQNTRASLTVTHATSPTFSGDLQQIESIAASLDHAINSRSNISFYAQYSRTQAGGPDTTSAQSEFFSASANYGYTIAREWRSNLSYTYRERHDTGGYANSSTVLASLVYNFNLYGKPPEAVAKTPSELAQESIARAQQALPFLAPR